MDCLAIYVLLYQQRAGADEVALCIDESRPAPLRVRRRGEERLIEQVFPVAGKLALRNQPGLERVVAAAVSDHECRIADIEFGRTAALKVGDGELAQGLDQAKAGCVVVGQRMPRHDRAAIGGEPDLRCLVDEVADSEDKTILTDGRAITGPLGTERRGRVGVLGNFGANEDDRIQHALEVELGLTGIRLIGLRKRPSLIFGHAVILAADKRRHTPTGFQV